MTRTSSMFLAIIIASLSLGSLLVILPAGAGGSSGNSATMVKEIYYPGFFFTNVDYSPDGAILAAGCNNGTFYAFETATWAVLDIVHTDSCIGDIKFSPDGTQLALGWENPTMSTPQGELIIFSTNDWTAIASFELRSIMDLQWSPDGTMLSAAAGPRVLIWDTSTWSELRSFNLSVSHSYAVGWSPDGSLFAYGVYQYSNGNVSIEIRKTSNWDLKESLSDLPSGMAPFVPAYIGWSSDGEILASTNYTAYFHGKERDYSTVQDYNENFDAEWRPVGRSLAVINNTGKASLMIINGTNGRIVLNETIGNERYSDISWSPNGTYIAVSSYEKICIFHLILSEQIDGTINDTDEDDDGVDDPEDDFPDDPSASQDDDGDHSPTYWMIGMDEDDSTTGLHLDMFPLDHSASMDTDMDGSPESWNPGRTQQDSTTGLHRDMFPTDPAASLDMDGDGSPDQWNPGKLQVDSTTGLHLDAFISDPSASSDSDSDGSPDGWNPGHTQEDSTSGLHLDMFKDDPAASIDTDEDGYPDSWNPGKGQIDSTTGLTLDEFPTEPSNILDSDKDGYEDKIDAFPSDPAEWIDADKDGHGDNGDAFPDDPDEWSDRDKDGIGDVKDAFPDDPAASVDVDEDGKPDAWNPGMDQKDSTTGLVLDEEPKADGSLLKETWLLVLMIGLTILIVISIIALLFVAFGRGTNDRSRSEDDEIISDYRREIMNGNNSGFLSSKEVEAIVSSRIGKGEISSETGTYITTLFTEE
jgi:hypothetical protein